MDRSRPTRGFSESLLKSNRWQSIVITRTDSSGLLTARPSAGSSHPLLYLRFISIQYFAPAIVYIGRWMRR
jgi:hypothetical protein